MSSRLLPGSDRLAAVLVAAAGCAPAPSSSVEQAGLDGGGSGGAPPIAALAGGAPSSAASAGVAGGAGSGTASERSADGGGGKVRDAAVPSCAALPLCESFETTPVGARPDPALFRLVAPGAAPGTTAVVDAIGARGSARSLRVTVTDRLYLRNDTVVRSLGPVVHARFRIRFDAPLATGHVAFATFDVAPPRDDWDENEELRFGGQDGAFHWNAALDDHNVPSVDPAGKSMSVVPAAHVWYCVELAVDERDGTLAVSIDGRDVAGLRQDGVPTPDVDAEWLSDARLRSWVSTLADFSIGFRSYGGGPSTLWFDDVALGSAPLGCD